MCSVSLQSCSAFLLTGPSHHIDISVSPVSHSLFGTVTPAVAPLIALPLYIKECRPAADVHTCSGEWKADEQKVIKSRANIIYQLRRQTNGEILWRKSRNTCHAGYSVIKLRCLLHSVCLKVAISLLDLRMRTLILPTSVMLADSTLGSLVRYRMDFQRHFNFIQRILSNYWFTINNEKENLHKRYWFNIRILFKQLQKI